MKKIILIILLVTCLTISLSGCGDQENVNDSKNGVTITLWTPGAGTDHDSQIWKQIFDQFNKEHQGKIRIKAEFIPRGSGFEYENKVSSSVVSGGLPDILRMDGPNISSYAYYKVIRPIDQYVTADDLKDVVKSTVEQGRFKGKLYALAPNESSVAVFYNKELVKRAGIKPPTTLKNAWTWDEFLQAVKKTDRLDKKVRGVVLSPAKNEWMTYMPTPLVWSNEGDIVSKNGMQATNYINSKSTVQALTYLQKLSKYSNPDPTPTEFEDGKAAFTIQGSWEYVTLQRSYPNFKYGVTFFPYSKVKYSACGDWAFGITSKSKHPKEAAEVIRYLMKDRNVIKTSSAFGQPPATLSAFKNMPEWNRYPRTIVRDQVIHTGHPRNVVPSYPILTQEFTSATSDILDGANPKERLDEAAQSIDLMIKRNFPGEH